MEGEGDPADVPAVARGEEREQTDGRVLGGVQGAAEDLRVDPGRVELVLGDRPPHRAGAQRTRREVELGLAQYLAGEDTAAQIGDDLVGDLDGAVAELLPPQGTSTSVSSTETAVVSRATVVYGGSACSTRATESSRSSERTR